VGGNPNPVRIGILRSSPSHLRQEGRRRGGGKKNLLLIIAGKGGCFARGGVFSKERKRTVALFLLLPLHLSFCPTSALPRRTGGERGKKGPRQKKGEKKNRQGLSHNRQLPLPYRPKGGGRRRGKKEIALETPPFFRAQREKKEKKAGRPERQRSNYSSFSSLLKPSTNAKKKGRGRDARKKKREGGKKGPMALVLFFGVSSAVRGRGEKGKGLLKKGKEKCILIPKTCGLQGKKKKKFREGPSCTQT